MLDRRGYEDLIPSYTLDQLDRYVDEHCIPSGFLMAVLTNNLFEAVARADAANSQALPDLVRFIYNRVPAGCYGSEGRVYGHVDQ